MAQPNVFIVYMPTGNPEAMVHYEDTIKGRVDLQRVAPHLSAEEVSFLQETFGPRRVAVWGSRDSPANRAKFARMHQGDSLLIVEGSAIKLMGKIALKTINPALSRELWRNLQGRTTAGWDLIYFIANPLEIDVPFREFCRLFGYQENYQLRGLTLVSQQRLDEFNSRYDDLYSILIRIRDGLKIETKPPIPILPTPPEPAREIPAPVQDPAAISQHVHMQCKLAKLGAKAGQKIWIPMGDRQRLRTSGCDFDTYEPTFSVGIDLPITYVENIDVVWKEEFRIDAAYEVENTTGIYSGLLRFADLSIVAPNSMYQMFIVAPMSRHEEARRQIHRPSFQFLKMRKRVLFLSYEEVNEIEKFFRKGDAGPSVEVMKSRAQELD